MMDDFIWVVTDDRPEASPGEKGLIDKIGLKQVPVDPAKLETEWNKMLHVNRFGLYDLNLISIVVHPHLIWNGSIYRHIPR